MTGCFSRDFVHRGPEVTGRLRGWLHEGRLTMPYDETQGVEHVLDLIDGSSPAGNIGR